MHVLRAEKGYPIIGQDTDGTVTPHDLGPGVGGVEEEARLHRQALVRPGREPPPRPQAAGRPAAARSGTTGWPRAPQLVESAELPEPPVPMLGHVTSSYRSAALGRTFALALVRSGRDRHRADAVGLARRRADAGDGDRVRPVRSREGRAVMADAPALRQSPLAAWADRFAALPRTVRLAEVPFCDHAQPAGSTRTGRRPTRGSPRCSAARCRSTPCTALRYGPAMCLARAGRVAGRRPSRADDDALEAGLTSSDARSALGRRRGHRRLGPADRADAGRPGRGRGAGRAAARSTCIRRSRRPAPACRRCWPAAGITIVVRDDSASSFTAARPGLVRRLPGRLAGRRVRRAVDLTAVDQRERLQVLLRITHHCCA